MSWSLVLLGGVLALQGKNVIITGASGAHLADWSLIDPVCGMVYIWASLLMHSCSKASIREYYYTVFVGLPHSPTQGSRLSGV